MQRIDIDSALHRAIVDHLKVNNALYVHEFDVDDSYDLAAIDKRIQTLTEDQRSNLLFSAYEDSQQLRNSCDELTQFENIVNDIFDRYIN